VKHCNVRAAVETEVWDLVKVSTNEIRRRELVFGGGSCVIVMFIVVLFVLVSVLKLSIETEQCSLWFHMNGGTCAAGCCLINLYIFIAQSV
jgi:pheromone shutdown protein TraB